MFLNLYSTYPTLKGGGMLGIPVKAFLEKVMARLNHEGRAGVHPS